MMKLNQIELALLAEALTARMETGDFNLARSRKGKVIICSPSHYKALNRLADKIVKAQEDGQ